MKIGILSCFFSFLLLEITTFNTSSDIANNRERERRGLRHQHIPLQSFKSRNNNIFIWTELSMQNKTAKHSTVCCYGCLCMSVSNSHSLSLPWGDFALETAWRRFFSNVAANSCLVSLFNRLTTHFDNYWGGNHVRLLKVWDFWKRRSSAHNVCSHVVGSEWLSTL